MRRLLWPVTLLLVAIGITIVVRRALHLVAPPAVPSNRQDAALDGGFARHPVLTMVHILPGLLFVLLAPLQFVRTLRTRRPALHRWTGRVVIAAGIVIGGSALVMGPQMAIGGALESAATMSFAAFFLFALLKALQSIRQGKVALHREWMIRAFAIGMAVTTTRPIVGVFFATSRLTHLTPHDFFGIAFWLGFILQGMAAELWIRHTRPETTAMRARTIRALI
jgi:uncharacterized membrane protein